jgi:competence protein ComEC
MKRLNKSILLIATFIYIFAITFSFGDLRNLRIHFINVGQGDCILIQTPNDKTLLVDSGIFESLSTVIKYLGSFWE